MALAVRTAIVLAAVACLAACGGEPLPVERHETGPLSGTEVRWIHAARKWELRLNRHYQAAMLAKDAAVRGGAGEAAAFERKLAPLRACGGLLRRGLAAAPSIRLRSYRRFLERACRELRRSALAEVRAVTTDPGALWAAEEARARANDLFAGADALLNKHLVHRRRFPVAAWDGTKTVVDPRFSRIASRTTHVPAEVVCVTRRMWQQINLEENARSGEALTEDAAGYGDLEAKRALVAPEACDLLAAFADRPRLPGRAAVADVAWAVALLAHEIEHLVAYRSEAETECDAVQRLDEVAVQLGASRRTARALADVYWRRGYPRLPAKYRTSACRKGGPLDRDPQTPAWP